MPESRRTAALASPEGAHFRAHYSRITLSLSPTGLRFFRPSTGMAEFFLCRTHIYENESGFYQRGRSRRRQHDGLPLLGRCQLSRRVGCRPRMSCIFTDPNTMLGSRRRRRCRGGDEVQERPARIFFGRSLALFAAVASHVLSDTFAPLRYTLLGRTTAQACTTIVSLDVCSSGANR